MNKTKRMFSILQFLNQSPAISAKELAENHNMSERSIYRYLSELKALGFRIHHACKPEELSLKHTLTPLTFTASEVLSLVAACQSLLTQKGLPYCAPLESALQKAEGALASVEDKRVFYRLHPRFTHIANSLRDYTPWENIIATINDCIRKNRILSARYDSFTTNQITEWHLDPYDLFLQDGNLYLAAFCHSRQKVCSFRVDRFKQVKLTSKTFIRVPNFTLNVYLGSSWGVWRSDTEITVRFIIYPLPPSPPVSSANPATILPSNSRN
ncbi:MAG: hypothetical protein DDT32_01816 [Syntrophomonadaceae bacterium]|nr:hypothetical protein [Bacillota bacterium]